MFVPCVSCDGKGHYIDRNKGDVETCVSCLGEGKHEVSQAEYEKFWTHFSENDFKLKGAIPLERGKNMPPLCGICEKPTTNGEYCKECEESKKQMGESVNKVLIRKGKGK